jgi:hypothetical protein
VLHPDNKLLGYWSLIMSIALVYNATWVPYHLSFDEDDTVSDLVMDYTVQFIYFIDILLTFFTGYYDKSQFVVLSNYQIAKEYFRGWFLFDVITIVPFQLLLPSSDASSTM